jgi:hypothetical protein
MASVWEGQDEVVAIVAFAGDLIIFGKNQFVVWSDGAASTLGLDPDSLYISDIIVGLGAITQFAITSVEGDVWFAAANGIYSMNRSRSDRTTPLDAVTANVEDEYQGFLAAQGDENDLTLVYSPEESFALMIFPTPERTICIEGKPTGDASGNPVYRTTTWTVPLQTATYRVSDRNLYASFSDEAGTLLTHANYADNSTPYTFSYESSWLDLGEQNTTFIQQPIVCIEQ